MIPFAFNYDPLANVYSGSCIAKVYGCTDSLYTEFDAAANTDDESCATLVVEGCTYNLYTEFDAAANTDDGSCSTEVVLGCTDSIAYNYNPLANINIDYCPPLEEGCIDFNALNYNPGANYNDNSCEFIEGCTYQLDGNYNPNAFTDDGSCIDYSGALYGCTNPMYLEYWNWAYVGTWFNPIEVDIQTPSIIPNTNDGSCTRLINYGCVPCDYNARVRLFESGQVIVEDGSCEYCIEGCTNSLAFNYDPLAIVDVGSCIATVYGCTDLLYTEYNFLANTDDGSCATPDVYGCTDINFAEYNFLANTDDGSCATPNVYGCTDSIFVEYSPNSTVSNTSLCVTIIVEGCMNPSAFNYDSLANAQTFCTPIVLGCTDSLYLEFDASVNTDNGSCATLVVEGCTDSLYLEFDASANTDDGSCATLIVSGCTDSLACNYNSLANVDDSSCFILSAEIVIEAPENSLNAIVSPEDSVATYAWSLNDTLITTETGSSLIPTQNGTYVLDATIGSCTVSDTFVVEGLNITDLEVVNLNVYPNPSFDIVNIEIPSSYSKIKIELIDLTGKILVSKIIESKSTNKIPMSLSEFRSQMCFVRIHLNDMSFTYPLLIQ